jgi:hypothetical protein
MLKKYLNRPEVFVKETLNFLKTCIAVYNAIVYRRRPSSYKMDGPIREIKATTMN